MYQLLVAGIREALLDTEDHVCPSWPYMFQLLVAGIHEALLDTEDHVCPSWPLYVSVIGCRYP